MALRSRFCPSQKAFWCLWWRFYRSIALPHWLPCSKQRTAAGSQTDVTPRVLRAGVVVRPRACPSVPVFLRRCSGVFPLGAAAIVTRAPLPGRGLGRATQGARTAPFFRQTVNAPPRRSCCSAGCSRAVVRGTGKRWARARGRPPGAVRALLCALMYQLGASGK